MKTKKTAIIVHGGALKSAFAAGAVYALSQIGVKTADIVLGTSSSVPTTAYFASGQFSFIREIWTKELGTKKFIKYGNLVSGEPVFDIDYLVNTVFKKKYPLNVEDIVNANSLFLIPVYDYITGRARLFNNHQKSFGRNFWEILWASMIVHDKHLIPNTEFHRFVDVDLDPFAIYRNSLIPKGFNTIVLFNHKDLEFNFKRWAGEKIFSAFQSHNFPVGVKKKLRIRKKLITDGLKLFREFEGRHKTVVISPPPEVNLGITSLLARSDRKLNSLFEAGEKTVEEMFSCGERKETLEVFIKRSKELQSG